MGQEVVGKVSHVQHAETRKPEVLQDAGGVIDAPIRFVRTPRRKSPGATFERDTDVTFRDFFAKAQASAAEQAATEQARVARRRNAWPVYGSGVDKYETVFREGGVMTETFGDFLARRREERGGVFTLDVMGTGGFLPQYREVVDGELGMTLVDHRSNVQRDQDSEMGKAIIAGDVLQMGPWREARQYLVAQGAEGFDLITCRPVGGWAVLRGGVGAHNDSNTRLVDWMITQRMYALLKSTGTLLVKMNLFNNYSGWIDTLATTEGLDVKGSSTYGAINITREENAPKFLPRV